MKENERKSPMMKNKKWLVVLAALVALGFSACSPSVNTYETEGASRTVVRDKRVVTDWGTEDFANVVEIRTGTTTEGIFRVQVELVNDDDDVGRVAYCVEWFDANGLKIGVNDVWIPLSIPPKKHETISLVAPNSSAKDFRISMMRTE